MKTSFSRMTPSVFVALAFILTTTAFAQYTGSVLYNFSGAPDGALPVAGLVADSAGNFYGGTTSGGGGTTSCLSGCGTIYELSPAVGGGYTETVLYRFNPSTDGDDSWSTLIFDASGNLYGETTFGGPLGNGTVFKLHLNGDGTWSLTTLYSFAGGTDGAEPVGGVTFDAKGNLYGTTLTGGGQGISFCSFFTGDGCGTVFKLTPTKSGYWTETQLHAFTGGNDGALPYGGVALDANGHLYGTAAYGNGTTADCQYGCGTVFSLTPHTTGGWRFGRIYAFNYANGAVPHGRLAVDSTGNLFGTTTGGGRGSGTVFQLSPTASGPWTRTLLHYFNFSDGADYFFAPESAPIFDGAGNLYGVTPGGGANGFGAAYELSPTATGWTFTSLYSFLPSDNEPNNSLVRDAGGNLFGTTYSGGISTTSQWGTIFELSPSAGVDH